MGSGKGERTERKRSMMGSSKGERRIGWGRGWDRRL